ncbi:Uncharacterised protein [Legionella steigerwaltii]|uniref:Uncharacterized protein n=1 Tax=Legionella steigerwaltii TaxID=460 RepID=A0A378L9P9_9GAMM|nr:hypothetical protein [Legionella steigerwaltii]KTD75714.1 hypothetical protein Lstg_2393 [Legionella steigerwaltii]STY23775.1 Uncharacterised protein [Legionella steigerwaltii]
MKTVVIELKRPGEFKEYTVNVSVTFDEDPFEFLDDADKPKDPTKELESIAQSIVAKKITSGELDLLAKKDEVRTHVLISGKKEGAFQVSYTLSDGIDHMNIPPLKPDISPSISIESALKNKFEAAKFTVECSSPEIKADQIWKLPTIREGILNLLQKDKESAAKAKVGRDLAQQKEEFLNGKEPRKPPEAIAFPALIKTIEKGDVYQEDAVKKLNALYGNKSLLEPTYSQIVIIEKAIDSLEQQLRKLRAREASLNDTISQDPRVVSFAQKNLHASREELQKTRTSLEKEISALREQLDSEKENEEREKIGAKPFFKEHVSDKYAQYTKYENTLEFTKQTMLTAFYNAAVDYYQQILKETEGNPEQRQAKIEELNESFAGIAKVDEYGNVNPTYKDLEKEPLKKVVAFTNGVLEKCNTGIFSARKLNCIQAQLQKANEHCANEYKKHYGDTIYKDKEQKMPFIMEKSWGRLKNISLNVNFESTLEHIIQSASDPEKLTRAWGKIPSGDAIVEQRSALGQAHTDMTNLDHKVKNFQRYLVLKDELDTKKALAQEQKKQIDAASESLNTTRDFIAKQIQDQPLEVQKYVLEHIDPNLAKSVFFLLPIDKREPLSEVLALDRIQAIHAESEINSLDKKHEILVDAIATAEDNLSQIKEEDIVEQLDQLRSALGEVRKSALDQRKLDKVTGRSKSYTENQSFVQDYVAFQKQLADATKILKQQIQEVTDKFDLLQGNASKEELLLFESLRQSLEDMKSSFDNTEYQRDNPVKNREELERLAGRAKSLHESLISEYERLDKVIKAQEAQREVQQPGIPPETQWQKEKRPPPRVTKEQPEGEPSAKRRKLHPSTPSDTIEFTVRERIKQIYNTYKEKVDADVLRLSNPEDQSIWSELFEPHKAGGKWQSVEAFKQEHSTEKEQKDAVQNANAVTSLGEIKALIENTNWKVRLGSLTGKEIKVGEESKKESKIVPPHIFRIYNQAIEGMKDPEKAAKAMEEINNIATKANSANVFKQLIRDEQTKDAYDAIAEYSVMRSSTP